MSAELETRFGKQIALSPSVGTRLALGGTNLTRRLAVVSAIVIATGKATVTLDTTSIPNVSWARNCDTLQVGDPVYVEFAGPDPLIVCRVGPTPFTTFTLLGGAVAAGGSTPGYVAGNGDEVRLKGLVTIPTGAAIPFTFATLPVDLRPTSGISVQIGTTVFTGAVFVAGLILVSSAGSVVAQSGGSGAGNIWVLDGLTFLRTQ